MKYVKHKIFHTIHLIHWAKLLLWFDLKCRGKGRNLEGVIGMTCICSKCMSKVGGTGQEELSRETGSRWGLCCTHLIPQPQSLSSCPPDLVFCYSFSDLIKLLLLLRYTWRKPWAFSQKFMCWLHIQTLVKKGTENTSLQHSKPDSSQQPFHLIFTEFHETCVLVSILHIKTESQRSLLPSATQVRSRTWIWAR